MEKKEVLELVLVPGMFSPASVFYEMKATFEAIGIKCRVIDFPLHYNFCEKVEFLLKELKKIKTKYQLLGHSAGAVIVMKAATIVGIDPQNIFLVAPAAPSNIFHLYPSVVRSFWCVMRDPYFMTKSISMSYADMRWSMLNALSEKDAKRVYEHIRNESGRFIFDVGFWFLDAQKSTFVDYREIKCPIDIFIGTVDRVTPLKVSRSIVKRIKLIDRIEGNLQRKISLHEFLGKGHWLLLEALSEIVSQVSRTNLVE